MPRRARPGLVLAGRASPGATRARLGRSGALCYHDLARGIRVRRARAGPSRQGGGAGVQRGSFERGRGRGMLRKTKQSIQRVQPRERRGRRGQADRRQDFRLPDQVSRALGRVRAAGRLFVPLREGSGTRTAASPRGVRLLSERQTPGNPGAGGKARSPSSTSTRKVSPRSANGRGRARSSPSW